jgi:transcriptional regulator with XRE-family HTH domain
VRFQKHRRVLGEMVRQYRKQASLTQEQLAEKAGLSPKYVGEVERGCVNISVDALARIGKALAVQVNDLTRGF